MNILVNIFNNSKKINPDSPFICILKQWLVYIHCLLRNMDQLFSLYIYFIELNYAEYLFNTMYENHQLYSG